MNERKDFGRDPDQLEAQIDVTRSKISEDLRAIGDKLTPENVKHELKEEAKHMVTNAKDAAVEKLREKKDAAMESVSETMGEVRYKARRAGGATLHYARDNAVPLALIGIGLGWLLASRRRRSSEDWRTRRYSAGQFRDDYYPEYTDEDIEYLDELGEESTRGRIREGVGRVRERVGSVASNVEHRAHDMKEQAEQKVSQAKEQASQKLHQVKEQASQKLHRGADRARQLGRTAQYKARDVSARSREYAYESPLAVGAIAVAAGVGVGMLLPTTRKEDEVLGPTRDRLVGEARETAQQLKSTVKETDRDLKTQVSDQMTH